MGPVATDKGRRRERGGTAAAQRAQARYHSKNQPGEQVREICDVRERFRPASQGTEKVSK